MLAMHGPTLWLYVGAVPLEIAAAAALFVPILRRRMDQTLERLVGTALILRQRGDEEASALLLESVAETYGRKAVDVAVRALS